MTTTTPESRATIAYVAYGRTLVGPGRPLTGPTFRGLLPYERDAWSRAAEVVWAMAKSGRARGDVLVSSPPPAPTGFDPAAWTSAVGVLWDLAVTGRATI